MPSFDGYPENFVYAAGRTLLREGVFTDHPNDRGGKTKYGITEAVAARHGYTDVSLLTPDQALEIYYRDYWLKGGCQSINSKYVAAELFDSSVLHGPGIGGRFIQRAYNILFCGPNGGGSLKIDGVVGPITAAKINSVLPKYEKAILNTMTGEQYIFFRELVAADASQQAFLRGWIGKRLDVPDDSKEP